MVKTMLEEARTVASANGELLVFHERADAFEGEESGMAFVHVIDGRTKAESFERANATDAEQNFLLEAHVEVAAVELRGDGAMFGTIARERWCRGGRAGYVRQRHARREQ